MAKRTPLFILIVIVYQPVWHAGFVWDDDDHITANPTAIGPQGLKEIWTTGAETSRRSRAATSGSNTNSPG